MLKTVLNAKISICPSYSLQLQYRVSMIVISLMVNTSKLIHPRSLRLHPCFHTILGHVLYGPPSWLGMDERDKVCPVSF